MKGTTNTAADRLAVGLMALQSSSNGHYPCIGAFAIVAPAAAALASIIYLPVFSG